MSSVIYTIHPNPPLKRRACGKTLSCIAKQCETQPHSRGEIGQKFRYGVLPQRKSSDFLYFYGSGGGLVSSVISTIPPNLPLIREACGKTLSCWNFFFFVAIEIYSCAILYLCGCTKITTFVISFRYNKNLKMHYLHNVLRIIDIKPTGVFCKVRSH